MTELNAECLFVLEKASQEPAHLIISDFRKQKFTPVSLNIGLSLNKNGRCEIDIYRRGVHRELCSSYLKIRPLNPDKSYANVPIWNNENN